MKKLKVMTIFGSRPEAIKMAPLVLELQKYPQYIEASVCVTAQHREMLDQVLKAFSIAPDYDLNVMQHQQTLNQLTIRVLERLEPVLQEAKPDLILVHGDTSTTFLASYSAFLQQIKIGHVEAGLRTWNKLSPFPEEMNRQLTGVMADMHFSPTQWSADNLRKENKAEYSIFVTGNTVIDAVSFMVSKQFSHPVLEWAEGKKLILMTAHRRESQGEKHRNVFRAVKRIADEFEDAAFVYPVHLSPAVKEPAYEILGDHPRIKLIEPLDIFEMYNFYPHCHFVVTDSGGIQEEAPSFGLPVLVLRDTTERPEGIESGNLKLVGTDENQVYEDIKSLLTDAAVYEKMSKAQNPYGDGHASERIVQTILYHFGYTETKPIPFHEQNVE